MSAKFVEQGGADLIVIYNSGRFRMAGRGSLAGLMPYGDANEIVISMAREVLPVVKDTAVLAGVCASDPFRQMVPFLKELKGLGFCGVQNCNPPFNLDWKAFGNAKTNVLKISPYGRSHRWEI